MAEKYISGKMSGGIGKRIGWNLICGINPVLCYGCIASYQSVPYRFKSCLIYYPRVRKWKRGIVSLQVRYLTLGLIINITLRGKQNARKHHTSSTT